jgi:SAM-dependent methyltransferase
MAELYSRAAPSHAEQGPPRFAHVGRRLVEIAGVGAGDSVLDLGTGRGAVLLPAAERVGQAGRVVGIDLAPGMIEHTQSEIRQRRMSWVSVQLMDAQQLDLADASFTHVLGSFVVFFFPDIPAVLAEMFRVLKPGGVVGLAFQRGSDPRWDWYEDLLRNRGVFTRLARLPGDLTIRRPGALTATLEEVGFVGATEIEEHVELGYPDVETWWASLWTHGTRLALEALSDQELAEVKAICMERASALAGPTGLAEVHDLVYVTAHRPAE